MVSNRATVTVSQGTLNGIQSTLPNGSPYYSFKGVPYATPPVGELRFELPVPLEQFPTNPLDCFEEGNVCLQNNPFKGDIIEGSEDCLYLNIYTPNLKPNKLMPVMVYIHGGAFAFGNANSDRHLPLYLMEEGVLVVTFTSRMGIFGYLYLPEGGIRGNLGLQDQLAVFKWIKDNISKFGGDPGNLTLFGASTGAASVHMHVLSPESKKYIHKAIMQGGNALVDWCQQKNPLGKARKLAKLMGCTDKKDEIIGKFLKNEKDPLKLQKHLLNLTMPEELRRGHRFNIKPIVEDNIPNAIITRPLLDLAMESGTVDIPLIMGFCNKEGVIGLKHFQAKLEEFDNDLCRIIPERLNLSYSDPVRLQIAEDIRKFYFKGKRLSKDMLEELIDLLSDSFYMIEKDFAAEIHSRCQHKSPLYMYRFCLDTKLNFFKKYHPTINGASHGNEEFYIFQKSVDDGLLQPGTIEELTVKRMCRMWSNFAKYGDPTPFEDEIIQWKWNPVKKIADKDEFTLDYLEIDDVIRMDKNPDKERMDFWRNIFEKYSNSQEVTKSKL